MWPAISKSKRVLCLILSVFCLVFFHAQARNEAYKPLYVKKFALEQGLAQSMVTGMHLDEFGLLWVGTGGGLHCFDGLEFTVFQRMPNLVASLPDNVIRDIRSLDGRRLLVTTSSAIGIFNREQATFHALYSPKLSEPVAFDIEWEQHRLFWAKDCGFFGVSGEGVFPVHLSWADVNPPATFVPNQGVSGNGDYALISGNGGIIEATRTAWNEFSCRWRAMPHEKPLVAKTRGGDVFVAVAGNVWIQDRNGVLQPRFETGIRSPSAFFVDSEHAYWIADDDAHRLFRFSGGRKEAVELLVREGKFTDTIRPYVKSMKQDRNGNIWIGTDGDGLLLYQPDGFDFEKGLIGFTYQITSSENYLWAATFKNGLWKLSADLANRKKVTTTMLGEHAHVMDVLCDTENRLWVASDKGLSVLDEEGRPIYEWSGTLARARLYFPQTGGVMLSSAGAMRHYFSMGADIAHLRSEPGTYFFAVLSHQGNWWWGGYNGLHMGGTPETAMGTKLADARVNSIIALDNSVWVGSTEGIFVYAEDGTLRKRFSFPDELPGNNVYALLADTYGHVWFSGDRGIGCISADGQVRLFGAGHNLQSLEFVSGASHRWNGRLYFGGIEGINGFMPSAFSAKGRAARRGVPTLTRLMLADTVHGHGIPVRGNRYVLSSKAAHVSGMVSSANYELPQLHHFSFWMKNYDEGWGQPEKSGAFAYGKLPPGNYELMARFRDAYGNWSEPASLFSLAVTPLFYETWGFRILVILGFAGLLVYLVRAYQRYKYARVIAGLQQMDAINQERLRIARDLHDDIGSDLTHIVLMASGSPPLHPESGDILETIAEKSRAVIDNLRHVVWLADPRNDLAGDLRAVIREYVSDFSERTGWICRFQDCGTDMGYGLSSMARRNVFLIVKECLHNTYKHTQARTIMVQWEYRGTWLHIRYTDDGKGGVCQSEQSPLGGRGLESIMKRAADVGGDATISPAEPGSGLCVSVAIPLKRAINRPNG